MELFGSMSPTSSDSSSASSPGSSPQSGLAEVSKEAEAASAMAPGADALTTEPLLRLLRCWFALLLEAQSSPSVGFGDGRRLRDHLDFYLLRADSGLRRHCVQARHRLVLGLQLLSAGSEYIADTEEFGRRLSVALGTTYTPPVTATTTTATTRPSSVAASTNTDVSSAVLGPTATTETTHYSTTTTTTSGAVSEMDFEDD
ncbi:unnamed protein product [Dibothriocephalus latus]|uniref:Uncharacterized protein n=1 Tax=Dibothriocephalus latus TaxID=60516 RepID=A0A3P7NS36_DIBLA|nr:unnamed protein product [Dibothriocephalus latus]